MSIYIFKGNKQPAQAVEAVKKQRKLFASIRRYPVIGGLFDSK